METIQDHSEHLAPPTTYRCFYFFYSFTKKHQEVKIKFSWCNLPNWLLCMPISLHWPAQLNAWMRAWNHWITEQPFLPVMRLSRDFLPWAAKSQAIDPAFRLSRAGKSLCHRGKKCTFWYTGSFLSHRPAAVRFRYTKQCSPHQQTLGCATKPW